MEISCTYVQGRRVRELVAPKPRLVPVLGVYLANAAFYRATSAIAHERLTRELESFGAPATLLDGCALATLADRAHAAELARLAQDRGVPASTPEPIVLPIRSKLDVAIDNAIEGVVRQSFALDFAHHRAQHAGDPEIRAVMSVIADEAESHAELAFDVAVWLCSILDPVETAFVDEAIRHASVTMPREIDVEPEPILCERAGIPGRLHALGIWQRFAHRAYDDIAPRVLSFAPAAA